MRYKHRMISRLLCRRIIGPFFYMWLPTTVLWRYSVSFQCAIDKISSYQGLLYGSLAYTADMSMVLLNDVFRIISKTIWHPCSPHLSPPNIFLCGAMKTVYSNNPLQSWWFENGHHRLHSECGPCCAVQSSRTQFSMPRMSGERRRTLLTMIIVSDLNTFW